MKILLAIDGSKYSKEAVMQVANRPFPLNTKVHIISVYENVGLATILATFGASRGYHQQGDKFALQTAENITKNAAKILLEKNPGLIITTAAIEGSPKNVILNVAEKLRSDLIVIGSHGAGSVERFLLGSVSHAVSLHAKCSVEIVRNKT